MPEERCKTAARYKREKRKGCKDKTTPIDPTKKHLLDAIFLPINALLSPYLATANDLATLGDNYSEQYAVVGSSLQNQLAQRD